MTLTISADPVPLRADEHGVMRVARTRVTLDSVLAVYQQGKSAEAIQHSFDSLSLADVHAVLAYYLRHQAEVDAYLEEQERAEAAVWEKLDAAQGPSPLEQRLAAQQARPER